MHTATAHRNSRVNIAVMPTVRTKKCGASTVAIESSGKGRGVLRKNHDEKAREYHSSSTASMTHSSNESHPLYLSFIDHLMLENFEDSQETFGDFGDCESGGEQDALESDGKSCHEASMLQDGNELAFHGAPESRPRLLAYGFSWQSAKMVRMPSNRFLTLEEHVEEHVEEHDVDDAVSELIGQCSFSDSYPDDSDAMWRFHFSEALDAALPIAERVEKYIAIKKTLDASKTSKYVQQESPESRTRTKKSISSGRRRHGTEIDSATQRPKEHSGRRCKDRKGSSRRQRGISRTSSTSTRETIDDTNSNASSWESVTAI